MAGQAERFPKTGVLEIPGVARLERAVVTKTRNGISVIGLRVTLLDGSGAVVTSAKPASRSGVSRTDLSPQAGSGIESSPHSDSAARRSPPAP